MSVTFYGIIEPIWLQRGRSSRFTKEELNLANTNAVMLAEYLGLEFDREHWCGEWDAHEVKRRCVLFRAVGGQFGDDGIPDAASGGPGTGRCRFIDCGVPAGYFAERVAVLELVADECIRHGIPVTYA